MDQILWCYHSNETSLTERLYGNIYSFGSVTFFSENFFVWPLLATKREHGASACSMPIPSDHCQVSYVVHRSWNLWNYLWHKHIFKSFFFVSFILLLVLTHLTYKLKLITMKFWKLSIGLIYDQLHFVYSNSSNFGWRVLRQQIFVLRKHKAQDPYLDDSFY